MKFSCDKIELERVVGMAERFTGKNVALPILGHVLLAADQNTLTVTATNLEHAVEFRVPSRVARAGKISVPAKIFSSLLQSFSGEKIEAEGERGNLHIRTQGRTSRLNGANPDDFPIIPKIKKTETVSVEALALAKTLSMTLPAASASEFKPELAGVFFKVGKDALTLCATDTFRLAESAVPLAKENADAHTPFIVPHRPAQELARILEGEEGEVSLSLGDNQLLAETGRGKVISRLIEGNFPEYKTIIPTHFTTSAHLERDEIIRGIRAASIFASKLAEVTLRFGPKQVQISAANPEVGEYHTEHAAALNGKEIAMSFNWRYFLDGIQALEDEEMFFGCNQESAPALLRNKSHTSFSYVVMPIRLT